jgi:hypothetical protein
MAAPYSRYRRDHRDYRDRSRLRNVKGGMFTEYRGAAINSDHTSSNKLML